VWQGAKYSIERTGLCAGPFCRLALHLVELDKMPGSVRLLGLAQNPLYCVRIAKRRSLYKVLLTFK